VLYGEGVEPLSFDVPAIQLSDHLPLVFDFEITGSAATHRARRVEAEQL
jgi:hypothetical protein